MKTIQTYLAWLCAIFFVLTGVTAILLFNIERRAFAAETYKQAFEKQGLYVRMPTILAEALHTSFMQDANTDPFLKVLTMDEWEVGLAKLLPPEDLKLLTNNSLDSLFAYLNNQSDTVSVSLAPLKIRLAGPEGTEVVKQVIDAQPDCTVDQLLQMGAGLINGEISLCKPPEEMMGLLAPMLESQLQTISASIPDSLTLLANNNSQADYRVRLNRIRTIMKLTVTLPIFLLAMLTLLAVRSLSDWFKWWGYSFLVTGVLSLVFALIGSPVLRFVMQNVMQRQAVNFLPPVLIPLLAETVGGAAGQILYPVVIQGAILGVIGFGMVIFAIILRNRR